MRIDDYYDDNANDDDALRRRGFGRSTATEERGPALVGTTLGERGFKRAFAVVGHERPRTLIGDDFLKQQVHIALVVDDAHRFALDIAECGDFEGHLLRSRTKDARHIRLGRALGYAHFKRHLVFVLGPFEILMRTWSKVFG